MKNKEKHKWKKVKNKRYYNVIGDTEHHCFFIEEYYECQICGIIKPIYNDIPNQFYKKELEGEETKR